MGTRERLLESGAALFAAKGFNGVGVEELGESVGLTGPSMYRHFRTKSALLGEMLITVSKSLLEGATEVIEENLDPQQTLSALIERHVEFAITYPDLIRVHERDFSNLEEDDARQVRRLQRRYVELWVDQIQLVRRNDTPETARTMAHAVFGLLNSTPRLRSTQRRNEVAALMLGLAQRALLP
ncbi:MAG TPA: TetR/AcrR family transcriptional regulator [Candidatus Paceibacterota bacterium]|nr:TetR/AcrR family transcriptional regulator [Candidatus Paceibacterota bacterium]